MWRGYDSHHDGHDHGHHHHDDHDHHYHRRDSCEEESGFGVGMSSHHQSDPRGYGGSSSTCAGGFGSGFERQPSIECGPGEWFELCPPFRRGLYGFNHRDRIRVVGRPTGDCINLSLKRGRCDKIFHLSARLDAGEIIRTDCCDDCWGEDQCDGGQPLCHRHIFTMDLEASGNNIEIRINGQYFCCFEARHGLCEVDELEIYGELELHSVAVIPNPDPCC